MYTGDRLRLGLQMALTRLRLALPINGKLGDFERLDLNQRSGRPCQVACDAQNLGYGRAHAVGFLSVTQDGHS